MIGHHKSECGNAALTPMNAMTVIGIGSFQGDDRAGWTVVERLQELRSTAAEFRKASVPHDVLDWLNCEGSVHIIDACMDSSLCIRRFDIKCNEDGDICCLLSASDSTFAPAVSVPKLRSSSSHQFDLMSTLRLAAELGRLPQQLVLWTVPITETSANAPMNESTAQLVKDCVAQLQSELSPG